MQTNEKQGTGLPFVAKLEFEDGLSESLVNQGYFSSKMIRHSHMWAINAFALRKHLS
jgi:hypothetical protein